MITGEGGNKFVFFLIICFWFSLCFFATNLSIDLLTFVRLSENKINGFKLSEACRQSKFLVQLKEIDFVQRILIYQPPLPKKKYGNGMEKVGPYLTHMWKWHGRVGWWYEIDMGNNFAKFQDGPYMPHTIWFHKGNF